MTTTDQILEFLHYNPSRSRPEIMAGIGTTLSDAQFKRVLAEAVAGGLVAVEGRARATRYSITPRAHLLRTVDLKTYYAKDVDERIVQTGFNFDLIRDLLPSASSPLTSTAASRTVSAPSRRTSPPFPQPRALRKWNDSAST